jgi:DNA-binding CsgD family transcriptional regulator
MWQPKPHALNTTTWFADRPRWLKLAVPHDSPGAQAPNFSTYVASYENVVAAEAGSAAMLAAAAQATSASRGLFIFFTSSLPDTPSLPGAEMRGNPRNLGFPFAAGGVYRRRMATSRDVARCRDRLETLSRATVDCEALRLEAIAFLRRTIGFERWCWPLADPETLVTSSGLAEHNYGPHVPRSLQLEYSTDVFAAKHLLARRERPVASLVRDTAGDAARSARWDEILRPAGIGDVAILACRDPQGCWGWIELYRDSADSPFDDDELGLLESVGPAVGAALRLRAMRHGSSDRGDAGPPGTLVLDRDLRPVSWTTGARAWIDALPSAALFAQWGMLPSVVYPTAVLARSGSRDARALVQSVDGRWVRIEAAALEGEREGEVAVNLRSATARETFDLLCRVYALSPREREIVSLLVDGLDTKAIAGRLFISAHTVQDHLKSVFAKVGIHSRRELLATLSDASD